VPFFADCGGVSLDAPLPALGFLGGILQQRVGVGIDLVCGFAKNAADAQR